MTQHLPLFDDEEDTRSIQPRQTKDDVEFRKERKRNRKKATPMPPPPAHGPCCLRCKSWNPPRHADEDYGTCSTLAVATVRNPVYRIEKGEVHDWESLERRGVPGEALRCGPGFSCYAYQTLIGEREDAA